MKKISFKVSARTARLIGRENVNSAEAAITELVKNCYDADASVCLLVFENRYPTTPKVINPREFEKLKKENPNTKILEECYTSEQLSIFEGEAQFNLKEKLLPQKLEKLHQFFREKNRIYIIDNGEGMIQETLENYWMTIGTNNKETSSKSKKKRVLTGAKGIGRFALDRLGGHCKLYTRPESKKKGFEWTVDWESFEKENASINEIHATLDERENINLSNKIKTQFGKKFNIDSILKEEEFSHGTWLEISNLRDNWSEKHIEKIFSSLETLKPPQEKNIFRIFLFSSSTPTSFGAISSAGYDDYDYKLQANIDEERNITIKIFRNEFDLGKMDLDFFKKEFAQTFPFDRDTFEKEFFKYPHEKVENLTIVKRGRR